MKKAILGVLLVGVGIVVLVGRVTSAVKTAEDVSLSPLSKSTTPIPLPKSLADFRKPETIADAQKKIRESSETLKKQLIPLMKQMPEEVKKMEALIRKNDELINALARTADFSKASEPSQN